MNKILEGFDRIFHNGYCIQCHLALDTWKSDFIYKLADPRGFARLNYSNIY